MHNYASTIYSGYLHNIKSSKELLLELGNIHASVTSNMPNAHPPKFDYEWKDNHTLIMTYKSQRSLIDLFVGIARAVGKYYKDNPKITKLSNFQVQIVFQE